MRFSTPKEVRYLWRKEWSARSSKSALHEEGFFSSWCMGRAMHSWAMNMPKRLRTSPDNGSHCLAYLVLVGAGGYCGMSVWIMVLGKNGMVVIF